MSMPRVQGSACSDSDSVFGRKVRGAGAGVGGRLCSGSPVTAFLLYLCEKGTCRALLYPGVSWAFGTSQPAF